MLQSSNPNSRFSLDPSLVETGFFSDGSVDREGCEDGLLWYTYCNNNPMTFVDPTGLSSRHNGGNPYRNSPSPGAVGYGGGPTMAEQMAGASNSRQRNRIANRARRGLNRRNRRADRRMYRDLIRNANSWAEKSEIRAQRHLHFGLEARTGLGRRIHFGMALNNLRDARANGRALSTDWSGIDNMFLKSDQWGSISWNNGDYGDNTRFLEEGKAALLDLIKNHDELGSMLLAMMSSRHSTTINVRESYANEAKPLNPYASYFGIGSDVIVNWDPENTRRLSDRRVRIPTAMLVHELLGHGYFMVKGRNLPGNIFDNKFGRIKELYATSIENMYRNYIGEIQRIGYGFGNRNFHIKIPQYNGENFIYQRNVWDIPLLGGI